MTTYGRARAKLARAVEILATGEGDVRGRLHHAFFHLVGALGSDLPPNIHARLTSIITRLTNRPSKYPWVSPLTATLQRMRAASGAKIAKDVVSLEYDLRRDTSKKAKPMA